MFTSDNQSFGRSQAGSTLIMVLVSAALGTIIAVAMSSMLANMNMSANNVKFRSDGDQINEEIRTLLSSSKACANSLAGITLNPGVPQNIYNIPKLVDDSVYPGNDRFVPGSVYGDRSLLLKDITLSNFQASGLPKTAEMTLRTNFTTAKQSIGAQEIPRIVNLKVEMDATNKILTCIVLAKITDGIWQRSPANLKDIFYNPAPSGVPGGSVGIGTSDPSINTPNGRVLHVDSPGTNASAIHFTNGTTGLGPGQGFVVGKWDDSLYGGGSIVWNYENTPLSFATFGSERMIILGNGNVGINTLTPKTKLDVGGDLSLNGKLAVRGSDPWLSLNPTGEFTSGIRTPLNLNAKGLRQSVPSTMTQVWETSRQPAQSNRGRMRLVGLAPNLALLLLIPPKINQFTAAHLTYGRQWVGLPLVFQFINAPSIAFVGDLDLGFRPARPATTIMIIKAFVLWLENLFLSK